MKSKFFNLIDKSKETPYEDIVKYFISVQTERIFHGQLTRISCENSLIKLSDNNDVVLSINYNSNDRCEKYKQEYMITNDNIPVYIDTPHILDLLIGSFAQSKKIVKKFLSPSINIYEEYQKVTSLSQKKIDKMIKVENEKISQIDVIETNNKIHKVLMEFNNLLNGKFISENSTIRFKENDIPVALDIRNLSTGIKSMAIIERCLNLGIIKENSTLILDEPEIHLHPEWQLKYAEFIVLLQKALNLTLLITTHSPQFLRAIECYTDKYEIMDRLNVYSIENNAIKNASYSEYGISEIYEKLSHPYDILQEMITKKYGEDDV